ncbi:MAG: hypothetical protein RIQ53_712 [Pseudomonadota bacterium]|jgi:hypothetical protein
MRHLLNLPALTLLAATTLSPAAHAVVALPSCTTMASSSGVSIEECAYFSGVNYTVSNGSDQELTAIAISTTAGADSWAWSETGGWHAAWVSEATWNSTASLSGAGSFATLFGTDEHAAFVYWTGELGIDGLPSGAVGSAVMGLAPEATGWFGFNFGMPASEFVAFSGTSSNGLAGLNVAGASLASAVPEPATNALLLGGLVVVGAALRRRR